MNDIAHRTHDFKIIDEHLKLLQASVIAWSSEWNGELFGAVCVDPRRPYGDKNVYLSMVRILGWKVLDENDIPDAQINRLEELHQQTETALRICLSRGKFETGIFQWPEPGGKWEKVVERPLTTFPSP